MWKNVNGNLIHVTDDSRVKFRTNISRATLEQLGVLAEEHDTHMNYLIETGLENLLAAGNIIYNKKARPTDRIQFKTTYDNDPRGKGAGGLIVITDKISRAEDYLMYGADDDRIYYPHYEHCAFITAASAHPQNLPVSEQFDLAENKPVMILTTQRYFGMDEDSRDVIFQYRYDDEYDWRNRKIVIIDEKAIFNEAVEIRIRNFNDCDTAIREGLPIDYPGKDDVIALYTAFKVKMVDAIRNYEFNRPDQRCRDVFYWRPVAGNTITDDDDAFFETLDNPDIKNHILSVYPDFYKDMQSFKELMSGGALFVATKARNPDSQKDNAYFLLPRDNRSAFFLGEGKAKFIILDATADIDPDYDLDYINLVDASAHNINLPLTIEHFDVSTSRTAIVSGDAEAVKRTHDLLLEELRERIKEHPDEPILLATYKAIETRLFDPLLSDPGKAFFKRGHFGGLRGLNEYRTFTRMAHIGFNRQPDIHYYVKYLLCHSEELDTLRALDRNESRKHIDQRLKLHKGLFEEDELNEIMFGCTLADFEQNIFRLAIRNFSNTDPVTVYTYWNCSTYGRLNQMIEARYAQHGATTVLRGKPTTFSESKLLTRKPAGGAVETNTQRLYKWLKNRPEGECFRVADARNDLGFTPAQFKAAKQNKAVKKFLRNECFSCKPGVYWRDDPDLF